MKILVAGGAGYVGSCLVPKLLSRGYAVTVADQLWFGNGILCPPGTYELWQRDVTSLAPDDLRGFDCVVFIAGLSSDPMAEFSPRENFIQNAAAPAYLSYVAKQAGVRRFVHGGSCSVYGYAADRLYDETSPAVSAYPYGISKLQGEFASMQLADGDFSVIGLRKGTISGYSTRMRFDLVVNAMFRSAMVEKVVRVNNPSIWRPILAMQDAVDGYVRAIEAAPDISGIFNLASENYTVGEIGDTVCSAVNELMNAGAHVEIRQVQDFRNYKVTWQKARDILGFHPHRCVRDIVADLADNYLDLKRRFDDDSCYNVRVFKRMLEERRVVA